MDFRNEMRHVASLLISELGIRQKEVALRLDCSQTQISLWMNDKEGLDKKKMDDKVRVWFLKENRAHRWVCVFVYSLALFFTDSF